MRSLRLALVGSLLLTPTAFADSSSPAPGAAPPDVQGWLIASRPGEPSDVMQVLPSSHIEEATGNQILYLNKNGTTLRPAQTNDARTGDSTLVNQVTSVPAWSGTDAQWQQVMACSRALWSRFNVTVTDVDPGSTPHIEGVFTTLSSTLNMDPNVGGVSPFTIGCNVIPNSIVFIFAQAFQNDPQRVCEVAGQELAHSYGLDHELLASDPMTYLDYTGARTFKDQSVSCGEYQTRQCGLQGECGSSQDSVQELLTRIGPATGGGGGQNPTVTITSPANNATVPPGFSISATASDDGSVAKVDLYVDGQMVDTKTAAPFTFKTSSGLGNGTHDLQTIATDNVGNTSTAEIHVTVSPGAPDPGTGPDGSGSGSNGDPSELVGGCQASGGQAGASLALLGLALGAIVIRRRR